MRRETQKRIISLSLKYKGYISTPELLKEGVTNRQIKEFTDQGILEKVSRGHYWFQCAGYKKPREYKALEVCMTDSEAVICADSACFYWGLLEKEPEIFSIATRRTDRKKIEMNFPIARHYYSEKSFKASYKQVYTEFGSYSISDIDRSVCDCIRFSDHIGEENLKIIVEAYQNRKDKMLERLIMYAEALRVHQKVKQYL